MVQFIVMAAMAVGGAVLQHQQNQENDAAAREKKKYDLKIATTNLWETRNRINKEKSKATQAVISQHGQALAQSQQISLESAAMVGSSVVMAAGSGAVIGEGSPQANVRAITSDAEQAIFANNQMGDMFAKQSLSDMELDIRDQRRHADMTYQSDREGAEMKAKHSMSSKYSVMRSLLEGGGRAAAAYQGGGGGGKSGVRGSSPGSSYYGGLAGSRSNSGINSHAQRMARFRKRMGG